MALQRGSGVRGGIERIRDLLCSRAGEVGGDECDGDVGAFGQFLGVPSHAVGGVCGDELAGRGVAEDIAEDTLVGVEVFVAGTRVVGVVERGGVAGYGGVEVGGVGCVCMVGGGGAGGKKRGGCGICGVGGRGISGYSGGGVLGLFGVTFFGDGGGRVRG